MQNLWEKMWTNEFTPPVLQYCVAVCKSRAKKPARKHFVCDLISSYYKEELINKLHRLIKARSYASYYGHTLQAQMLDLILVNKDNLIKNHGSCQTA